jgi:N-methylhydantoinase A/oxoprolinase/acetone carboxylase beta subunit
VGAIRPLAEVVKTRTDMPLVRKLVSRGVLRLAGLTPSDACHVLGLQDVWDGFAAEKAARLFARRITNGGLPLAPDARALAERIVQTVRTRTAECLMATALAEDGFEQPEQLARHPLVARGLAQAGGAARVNIGLSLPVIGLGASAHTYYPALAGPLGCSVHVPEHGGVANAIGAVVGQVQVSVSLSITSPADGQYLLHLPSQARTLTRAQDALDAARDWLTAEAMARADAAGAAEARVSIEETVSSATIEGRVVMVGAELTARATGRPRL